MSLYFRLLRLQLSQRFGLSALRAEMQENRKRALGKASVFVVAVLSIGVLIGLYTWMLTAIMPTFQSLGMERIFLGVILLASMLIVFIFGLVYLIGLLFFSKDTEFLAALPIPQRTVFAAKFSQVLGGEIGTTALLLAPALVVYGVTVGAGVGYWFLALLMLFVAPCIPLALSGFVSLVLMRFNALWRRRDLMTTISAVAAVLIYVVGWTMLSSRMESLTSPEAVMELIQNSSALLHSIVSAFPPAGWAAEALLGQTGSLLLFLGVSAVALALVVFVADKIYYAGSMAQLEAAARTRKVKITSDTARQRGVVWALFMREWKIILRTPVYALNSLIMLIMGPLMLLLPMLMQGMTTDPEMREILSLLNNAADSRIVLLVLAALSLALGVINTGAMTSFSREGKLFYLLRVIPVSPRKQVLGKFLFGYSSTLLCVVLMCTVAVLMLGISPLLALGTVLFSAVVAVCPLALSMLPDTIKPKLSWNSETEAIKQNMNAILGMLIAWGVLFVMGVGAYFLAGTTLTILPLTLLIAGVAAMLGWASLVLLGRTAHSAFERIEG